MFVLENGAIWILPLPADNWDMMVDKEYRWVDGMNSYMNTCITYIMPNRYVWEIKHSPSGAMRPQVSCFLSLIRTIFGHDLCNLCHHFLATVGGFLATCT